MTHQKTGPETQAQALTTRWKEREEKIATAEILADLAEEAGVEDVLTGAEDLAAAGELEEVSKEALVAGAAEVTAGLDDLASAERVAFLCGVVAGAGVVVPVEEEEE